MKNLADRLRDTSLDKDNFPRMNSERWFPVGLAKEAADRIEALEADLAQWVRQAEDNSGGWQRAFLRIEALEKALREARQYVSDAGGDEDPETQHLSALLLIDIDAALAPEQDK